MVEPEPQPEPDGPGSFDAFYRAQYPGVYAFVLRRLAGHADDVADVTAEVFATAWRRADQMPPPPHDRLWVYGVARRVVSRHHRGHRRRGRLLQRLADQAGGPVAVAGTVGPVPAGGAGGAGGAGRADHDDHLADRVDRVREAMDRLRPADREVLALVLWDQLSHAEAGQLLGCSANAVGIRLHRARARLRQLLEERPSGEDEEDRT
ncbi:MAG TPA: sigma-70 family RNA polymerase sigma factor [Acidimicrobiales bacterium]|nr:sigma-70 family RNA polymerase sigma factor [Acidimicrobiales bacterium]